jgi:hypothetical protein
MVGPEIRDSAPDKIVLPRGILDPHGSASRIRVNRYGSSWPLAPFIDHLWVGEWNLEGRRSERQRVLPSPNAHLVIGSGCTSLFGVVRGFYSRQLNGSGRVLGVRFRTGGLRPFLSGPVAALTDRTVPAEILTGLKDSAAEARVVGAGDDQTMMHAVEALLEPGLPTADPAVDLQRFPFVLNR